MAIYALSPTGFADVSVGKAVLACGRLDRLCRDESCTTPVTHELNRSYRFRRRYRHKPRIVALDGFYVGAEVYTWPGGAQVTTSTAKMVPPRIVRLGILAAAGKGWRVEGPGHLLDYHGRRLAKVQLHRAYRTLAGLGAGP